MSEQHPARGSTEAPVGEERDGGERFTIDQIATTFAIERDRVVRAVAGEFGQERDQTVNSHQAQHLAEVLLVDQPLDQRQAALMTLGAFTPRSDADFGLGDARPDEESDLQAARADTPPTELAARRSSHAPSTQPEE